jgi:hypothetical protein
VRRDQLEHAIRTACQIAGLTEVIIAASQAILGTFNEDELPFYATRSLEIDILPIADDNGEITRLAEANSLHYNYIRGHLAVIARGTPLSPLLTGWLEWSWYTSSITPRPGPIKLRHIIRHRAAWSAVRSRERQVGLKSNMCSNGLSAPARTLRAMFTRSSPQR